MDGVTDDNRGAFLRDVDLEAAIEKGPGVMWASTTIVGSDDVDADVERRRTLARWKDPEAETRIALVLFRKEEAERVARNLYRDAFEPALLVRSIGVAEEDTHAAL